MRRAARVDANQAAIVAALKRCGAYVWVLGLPVDLLVGHQGRMWLVEVKANSKKKFTPLQEDFIAHWNGIPVVRVESVSDALNLIQR